MRLAIGVLLGVALAGATASAQDRPLFPEAPLARPDALFPAPGGPLAGQSGGDAPCSSPGEGAAAGAFGPARPGERAAPRAVAGAEASRAGEGQQGARAKGRAWGDRPLYADTDRPLWDTTGGSAAGKREKRPAEGAAPARARPGEASPPDREKPLWGGNEPEDEAEDACADAAGTDRPLWNNGNDSLMGRTSRP